MEKNNGWISLHRKILQSPIFDKPSEYFKVWIYLLLNVDHQNGIGFFSWGVIENECHITQNQLRKCFNFMEQEQMITRKKLPRGVEITILNWDKYQHTQSETSQKHISKNTTKNTTEHTTETANEINNNAEIQTHENLKAHNEEHNKAHKKESTHNTINTISTISNNPIVSLDTIKGEVLNPSLNENEKEKETSIESASGEQKVSNKAIFKLVAMFCEEMGLEFRPPHTIDINSKAARDLLKVYTIDEIMEAVRYGKEQYIKDKKDPRQMMRNLHAVSNSIESWRGALNEQKEKQEKKEAGYGYF